MQITLDHKPTSGAFSKLLILRSTQTPKNMDLKHLFVARSGESAERGDSGESHEIRVRQRRFRRAFICAERLRLLGLVAFGRGKYFYGISAVLWRYFCRTVAVRSH